MNMKNTLEEIAAQNLLASLSDPLVFGKIFCGVDMAIGPDETVYSARRNGKWIRVEGEMDDACVEVREREKA